MATAAVDSAHAHRHLRLIIDRAGPLRRQKFTRYDTGWVFRLNVTGVCPARRAHVSMVVEKFIGGGFAGQVYRVRLDAIEAPEGPIIGLEVGRTYAVKIITPPSAFSLAFRNTVYALAYQGPFSAQVHPAASRSGVLWQKLIRRAARIEFGRDDAVCDTYATFFDDGLGSHGEINEWVVGRNWKFELDERYFDRVAPDLDSPKPDFASSGAAEYYAKKHFMARFVRMLHTIGAPEFARQYEWWTAKSQPNVLKREGSGDGPADGLCAIDFRAGLALLPFLPMSPGDVPLIWRGLKRGALVQFDRGDLQRLEGYVNQHADQFADLRPALEELKQTDPAYRRSLIDVTHHGLRPLWDGQLRRGIRGGFVHNWRARHLVDGDHADRLHRSAARFTAFFGFGVLTRLLLLGVLVAAIPAWSAAFDHWGLTAAPGAGESTDSDGASAAPWYYLTLVTVGAAVVTLVAVRSLAMLLDALRCCWGHSIYRQHVAAMLKSPSYLLRAVCARQAERLVDWLRTGRRCPRAIVAMAESPRRFWPQAWLLGWLPPTWHRTIMEPLGFAWPAVRRTVSGTIQFLRDAAFRQKWLEEVIDQGHKSGELTAAEYAAVRPQAGDAYIRTYLLCMAGHAATSVMTEVGTAVIALVLTLRDDWSWVTFCGYFAVWTAIFAATPISPGSICRGLIVLAVMIKQRNFRDYWVAAVFSMMKYVGYLAFPIQMAAKYPVLSRLMAGRWAAGAVHVVPVFGEHGALLEHTVLDTCFNKPVSIRRRIADGRETTGRLVTKVVLAGLWFVGSAVAALLAWKATRAPEFTLSMLTPMFAATGVAMLAPLAWAVVAPSFALVRRTWPLLALLALVPAACIVLPNWSLLFG